MSTPKHFTNFEYIVRSDFILENKREVIVLFDYLGIHRIKLSLFFNKEKGCNDEYYINEAKKIINQKIKDGSLEKHSEKCAKEQKKKKILTFVAPIVAGAMAIAGISVGTYFAVKPTSQEVKVDVPEVNGLAFSNQKAYIGQDYDTNISVNKMLTDLLLPDTLKTVKSGNRTVLPTEYTYSVSDNKETGSLHIPGKYIEGDVTITLELVSPVPPVKYASIELSENSKQYGKLKYGGTTDYKVDISDEIDKKEFAIEFVPETGYEDTKFVVAFADSNFTATYINKKLYVTGTNPLKDQDQLVVTLTEATLRDQYLTFTSLTDDSEINISYSYYGSETLSMGKKIPNLECSTDGGLTWIDITFKLPTTDDTSATLVEGLDVGDTVMFRGDNPTCFNYYISSPYEWNIFTFGNGTDDEFKISGNIMSLLDKDDFATCDTLPITGCFESLFEESSITDASELILPANSLTDYCYQMMFASCLKLTSAPELPAMELAENCYQEMFAGTAITTAPNLKAINLKAYCYHSMFLNCKELTTSPVVSATTLASACYRNMFEGCDKLTSTIIFPNVEYKPGCCRHMYYGCTSLSTIYPINYTNSSFGDTDSTFVEMFYNAGLNITISDTKQDNTIFHVGNFDNRSFCDDMFDDSVEMEKNKYYNFTTPWYKDTEYLEGLEPSDVTKVNPDGTIGEVKTLMVNGVKHQVRLIGVNEDYEDEAKTKPIHTTWEFANLLSDASGNSLATQWNDTNNLNAANHNYRKSSIRYALNKETDEGGCNHILWAQKGGVTWSTNYKNKCVLDMLPSGLVSVLKAPSKYINIKEGSWSEQTVNDKLFLLSLKEMGGSGGETLTSTYTYYNGADDDDRIKKQVNNEGAYTTTPRINSESGQVYFDDVFNYAGYNGSAESTGEGGYYWLRSPYTNENSYAWLVLDRGSLYGYGYDVYSCAFAVAPAFCI